MGANINNSSQVHSHLWYQCNYGYCTLFILTAFFILASCVLWDFVLVSLFTLTLILPVLGIGTWVFDHIMEATLSVTVSSSTTNLSTSNMNVSCCWAECCLVQHYHRKLFWTYVLPDKKLILCWITDKASIFDSLNLSTEIFTFLLGGFFIPSRSWKH